jgi:putative spermidine/putrescine transport system permease protein
MTGTASSGTVASKRVKNEAALERAFQNERLILAALTLPAATVVVLLLMLPMLGLFWQSVIDSKSQQFTSVNYARILLEPGYITTFERTFSTSIAVTAICVILGYPIAFLAAISRPRSSMLILALVMIPFWTSVLVRTYSWLVLLQRNGLVNRGLIASGLISEPLALVHNLTGTIIGMVHVMLPFVVLTLYGSLKQIPDDLGRAGASLGAKPFLVFSSIVLPLSAPGLVAGAVFVFVLSLGFYITPELMGGGRTIMVSMLVQRNIDLYSQFGAASAVAFVLLLITVLILWLADKIVPIERILGER